MNDEPTIDPTPPQPLFGDHPTCHIHPEHAAAGFCNVCRMYVCIPCGLAHQEAHDARRN